MEASQICQFYRGKTVFITGGTGFVGKILIEKLLRTTDVATIYLLVREKRGKDVYSRLDELFDSIIFDRLKSERPKFRHRVVPMSGDCSVTGIGLTITDRQKLLSEVNIVFHVAATVRFDENLKLAYAINVSGTGDVIELCRQMTDLKSVIHVSTAYSNCFSESIDEKFYDYPVQYDQVGSLLEKVSKSEAEQLTPKVIGSWPNTYTFTKALAESLVRRTAENLPIGVFRPSIVVSTYREPLECWTDNLYGPSGAVVGAASGVLRVFPCRNEAVADIVPVDTCVAGMIAVAWDVANKTDKNIPIYNYVSSVDNSLTWGEYLMLNKLHGCKYPLQKAIWRISMIHIPHRNLYLFLRVLLHLIPAFFFDCFCVLTGQKPTLTSMYLKIHKFSDVLAFFAVREWKFKNTNLTQLWEKMNKTDQTLFPFSLKTVSWTSYMREYVKGVRVYLLKDPLSTLDEARLKMKRFDIAHNVLKYLGIFMAVTVVWVVILKFAALFSSDSSAMHRKLFNSL